MSDLSYAAADLSFTSLTDGYSLIYLLQKDSNSALIALDESCSRRSLLKQPHTWSVVCIENNTTL